MHNYVKALDGVRGIAIGLVLVAHLTASRAEFAGAAGVTLFFVLSGYLITSLLLAEYEMHGYISFPRFYARRALRLFPALLVVIVGAWALFAILGDNRTHGYWLESIPTLLYLRDFLMAAGVSGNTMDHTWSLAVEEQFYIVWPLALTAIVSYMKTRLRLAVWTMTCIAVLWHLVAVLLLPSERVYFAPDTNAFAILAGCALATVAPMGKPRSRPVLALACVAAIVVGPILVGRLTENAWDARNFLTVGVAAVSIALLWSARGVRWLELAPLVWFGQRSYGIYLWHAVFLAIEIDGEPISGIERIAAIMAALVVAWASFRFVESPITALKRFVAARPGPRSLPSGRAAEPEIRR
jgi:peptidoglycan/LPS O-acetylase OafA/YrhL